MALAAHVGIPTAEVSILRPPTPVLVIKRFDRLAERDRVRRLHIIDACQALNVPVAYKYERNFGSGRDVRDIREGVSFPRLFSWPTTQSRRPSSDSRSCAGRYFSISSAMRMPTARTSRSSADAAASHSLPRMTWSASCSIRTWRTS